MVVMGVHVWHVRHRPWLVLAVSFVFITVMAFMPVFMVSVVLDSGGCPKELGGNQLRVEASARQ
jgi:hypothetical protein